MKFVRWLLGANGVTVTLLLGVIVNLLSNQISTTIQRQRYMELLEYEIRQQTLIAANVFDSYKKNNGVIINKRVLNDDVYKSGLANGYLLDINPAVLSSIVAYYGAIPSYNELLNHYHSEIDSYQHAWEQCVVVTPDTCKGQEAQLQDAKEFYSSLLLKIWQGVYDGSLKELSTKFSPTQTRLHSPWLRLLMGSQTLGFLE